MQQTQSTLDAETGAGCSPDPGADYFGRIRHDVMAILPAAVGDVLDVGCGNGATGVALLSRGQADVVDGIELNPQAAESARRHYRNVWATNLDTPEAPAWLASDLSFEYDTIMCNDILEHLRDPWTVLAHLTGRLADGGRIIVSVPNIQSVEVVAPLLMGRFTYRDSGVLDRTHLRFFTRRTARELIRSAGLTVLDEATTRIGETRSPAIRAAMATLGPFGVRQLIYVAGRSAHALRFREGNRAAWARSPAINRPPSPPPTVESRRRGEG
jgi:2-polyprenyl-3-methyl-5-hydroxy-6-metoxy-1,4-benzoquinol methylase